MKPRKNNIVVSAFYKFVDLKNYKSYRQPLLGVMRVNKVKGTILLAKEGVNGTVAAEKKGIENLLSWLKSKPPFKDLSHKESYHKDIPFYRSKVKLKKEIVTMGVKGINPRKVVGTYVKPKDWNKLISDPDVTIIDTRNDYEVDIGTFKNAVDPKIKTFRDFPGYVKKNLSPKKHKKVAMFCTGGIRCEKSTAYLKGKGFKNVYHLQGGILKYLEEVPKKKSLWKGECFVFDGRVAVDHNLKKGKYDQCYGCRHPVSKKDKKSKHFIQGVSCPHCYKQSSKEQKKRFQERQKQVDLGKKRKQPHLGEL